MARVLFATALLFAAVPAVAETINSRGSGVYDVFLLCKSGSCVSNDTSCPDDNAQLSFGSLAEAQRWSAAGGQCLFSLESYQQKCIHNNQVLWSPIQNDGSFSDFNGSPPGQCIGDGVAISNKIAPPGAATRADEMKERVAACQGSPEFPSCVVEVHERYMDQFQVPVLQRIFDYYGLAMSQLVKAGTLSRSEGEATWNAIGGVIDLAGEAMAKEAQGRASMSASVADRLSAALNAVTHDTPNFDPSTILCLSRNPVMECQTSPPRLGTAAHHK